MTYSDDVLGRARVASDTALDEYYQVLKKADAGALWTVANDIEPWYPQPKSAPMLWKYRDMRPLVEEALGLVNADDAGRRVIMLVNPGRVDASAAVGNLYTGLQIMGPGESMTAHRHMAAALRFVVEGKGAWTVVDGQKLTVGPRDFAITPSGAFHEHGNESSDTNVIWQDGLDIPLVNALDAGFYEVHPNLYQDVDPVPNHSYLKYGVGQLRPYGFEDSWPKRYSPLFAYPWEQVHDALQNVAKTSPGSECDGYILEYSNPITGGSVMPTLSAHMQMLLPGQATKAHRHTGSVIYNVAQGAGYTVIAGKRYDWTQGDIFCVPSWAWHEHVNIDPSQEAFLFSFNDFPVMRSLDFWREEIMRDNDGHQEISE
ncbi:cupin domain-containing protein [Specibacter sp. RAF43]|uniref:cupin domain-containing protein n=1 Tax=Specibacter sp. RAF43 TaxID=3233057 RepID=UPI003F9AB100